MVEGESSVAEQDRASGARTRCRRLLVVDPAGLLEAPLDAADVDPVDVAAVPGWFEGAANDPPLEARPLPAAPPAGDLDDLEPVTPTVLRHEGAHVLAWHEEIRGYVSLDLAHLAVLDLVRFPMTVAYLIDQLAESDWPVDVAEVRVAVSQLHEVGLLRRVAAVAETPVAEPIAGASQDDDGADVSGDDERGPSAGSDAPAAGSDAPAGGSTDLVAEHGPQDEGEAAVPAGPDAPAPPDDPDARLPGLMADLPMSSDAVRILAFRVVGRTRRRVRRAWVSAGRGAAQRLLGHFGTERDDWPDPPPGDRSALSEDHASGAPAPGSTDVPGSSEQAIDGAGSDAGDAPASPVGDDPTSSGDDLKAPGDGADPHLDEVAAHRSDADAADSDPSAPHAESGDDAEVTARPGVEAAVRASVDHRTPVFGVYFSPEHNANLGLGLIISHARIADGGSLNDVFDLRRASIDADPMLHELERSGRQAVVLCSDYMWSLDHNLEVSRRVKAINPSSLVVHGGPHAPKYEADAQRFLDEHPYVDVLVRGEGEVTVAHLLRAVGPAPEPDRLGEVLTDVEGLTFRDGPHGAHRVVRTTDRARATDMSAFPSPYLTGEFDEIDTARWRSATVESNRGCPYGCTFCDWGAATNSRIRQFDLDRVRSELEWLAARGISEVFLSDANFGLFARDVDIARHIAELKQRYGAPSQVICSFAKNTVKYTAEIVRIWVEAGICAEGSVALQTTDEVTLANVERSNIKVEKYDALADEFRRHRLPIVTDLLMGLPGATVESFKNDLQRCLDQEVTPRMMETVLLPNSPMNAPEYRERFAIETDAANVLVATSSYTREDFEEMKRVRLLFRACEHYGLLRHLFRWLQIEQGIRALDLLHEIDRAICEEPEAYPLLTWVGRYFDLITAPPGGWPPFYDEVVRLLGDRLGVERDEAMDTVLAVQEFLMPTHHRSFPARLELDHDYVAWHRVTSSGAAPGDLPRLVDMGPGELVVDDPAGVCDARLLRNGFSIRREEACDNPFWVLNDWELDSELARPMATAVPLLTTS